MESYVLVYLKFVEKFLKSVPFRTVLCLVGFKDFFIAFLLYFLYSPKIDQGYFQEISKITVSKTKVSLLF